MRRLNDTEALVERPFQAGEEHTISTRKIANGYLVRQSSYNPNTGECHSAETFTKNPPKIKAPSLDGRQKGPAPDNANSLADAAAYLGKDV